MNKNFYNNYFNIFKNVISFSEKNLEKIIKIEKLILKVKKEKKKFLFLEMEEALQLLVISQLTVIIS